MSTLPGAESWRDAGLESPGLEDAVEAAGSAEEPGGEDYDPEPPEGLGSKEASEADVVEQLVEVGEDEREDYP